MGVLQTSKNQDLLMSVSTNVKYKGKKNGKDPKAYDLEPKENQNYSEGALGSKRKKKFENINCPYCKRGFHHESQCIKKKIDQLYSLLK